MAISRPYRDETDYARLRRFLQGLPAMPEAGGNCTIGDLDWWRFTHENPEKMQDVQLWLGDDGETVTGWIWPDRGTFDCFIDPRHAALFPEMLAWVEATARTRGDQTISIICNDRDEQGKAILKQAGYEPAEFHYAYRGQSITGDLERPSLPEGFHFRDMRLRNEDISSVLTDRELEVFRLCRTRKSNEEIAEALFISRHTVAKHVENIVAKIEPLQQRLIERRVELHRAVWAPSKMTVAKHRAVMASPTYRSDLDLIAVAPNGDFASYAIVWHDPVNRIGVFEPVGCHPEYRQRGLTRAVMLEGMTRLKELGARKAFVNSLHNSLPANRLYEASGFRLVDRQRKWTRALS